MKLLISYYMKLFKSNQYPILLECLFVSALGFVHKPINDVKVFGGEVQELCDDSIIALVINSEKMSEEVKIVLNCVTSFI